MRNNMHSKTRPTDQRGIVSFMVTLIMMLVISLIVIGFTQVAMRSQRDALDNQLSSQAFYAAESGVNKAVTTINQDINTNAPIAEKSTCASGGAYDGFALDGTNVAVTCIMVNTHPDSIVGSATQNKSFVTHIVPVDSGGGSSPLNGLTFSWTAPDAINGAVGCGSADINTLMPDSTTQEGTTCSYGMLRVDVLKVNGAVYDFSSTKTFYMQPRDGADPSIAPITDINSFTGGKVVKALCSAEKCSANVSGVGGVGNTYYVRMSTLYKDAKTVEITGKIASGAAHFDGAQAVVDATGRAQDVLRRVQVRYSLARNDDTPPWAVAGKVCKRLTVVPGVSVTNDPSICN